MQGCTPRIGVTTQRPPTWFRWQPTLHNSPKRQQHASKDPRRRRQHRLTCAACRPQSSQEAQQGKRARNGQNDANWQLSQQTNSPNSPWNETTPTPCAVHHGRNPTHPDHPYQAPEPTSKGATRKPKIAASAACTAAGTSPIGSWKSPGKA